MEQASLLDMATQLLQLIAPLIARGVLAKLDEQASDATTGLLKRAWDVLQRRLTSNEAQSALTVYQSLPQSKDIQALVAQQIVASFKDDSAAIGELQEVLQQLQVQARKTNA